MTPEEAFYCTIIYHATHCTEGNELLHAICKCIVDDAKNLEKTNLSFDEAMKSICESAPFKIAVEASKPIEKKTDDFTEKNGLKVLPEELAI